MIHAVMIGDYRLYVWRYAKYEKQIWHFFNLFLDTRSIFKAGKFKKMLLDFDTNFTQTDEEIDCYEGI